MATGDHVGQTEGEFSVCQFFPSGDYEYVRRWVSAEEAIQAFKHYTTSVGASMGTTTEVIVTDGGDCTNMHWKYGEGIIFPTKEELEKATKQQT